jgi:hypothetical protein
MQRTTKKLLLVGEGFGLSGAVVLGAVAAAVVVRKLGSIPAAYTSLLSAALFASCIGVLVFGPPKLKQISRWLRGLLRTVAPAALLFLVSALLLGVASPSLLRMAAIIFVVAAVEETVFRGMLPRRLAALGRVGWGRRSFVTLVAAPVVAQICFAAAHLAVAAPALPANPHIEGARLLTAGLLYSVLAMRYGLWLPIGVHAALNFHLLYGTDFSNAATPFSELALIALSALAVLAWPARRNHTRSSIAVHSPTTQGGISHG